MFKGNSRDYVRKNTHTDHLGRSGARAFFGFYLNPNPNKAAQLAGISCLHHNARGKRKLFSQDDLIYYKRVH